MKILFDTNVVIDAFTMRDYDYKASRELLRKVVNEEIEGFLSAKQITDIYYILRKYVSDENTKKQIIKDLLNIFKILPILPSDLSASFNTGIPDFEDAVLEETARVNMINYIVTRNIKDFEKSKLAIVTPEELVALLNMQTN